METERLLRKADIVERTGLSYATIYNMMKAGTFPQSRRAGKQAVGWIESEVTDWIRNLPIADPKDSHYPTRKSNES